MNKVTNRMIIATNCILQYTQLTLPCVMTFVLLCEETL